MDWIINQIYPEKLKRIAKENIKLADTYMRNGQKRAIKGRAEQAQQQSKMNTDNQVASGQAVEQAKQQTMQAEMSIKGEMEKMLSEARQKEVILTGIFGIYQKGVPMPDELKALTQEIITNVGIPLFADNIQMKQQIQQGMQQEQDPQQQEQNPQEESQEQGMQQNPQEENQEQQGL